MADKLQSLQEERDQLESRLHSFEEHNKLLKESLEEMTAKQSAEKISQASGSEDASQVETETSSESKEELDEKKVETDGTNKAIDSTLLENLQNQVIELKHQLASVNEERAKLSEALKLSKQAKEETRAALENEKQILSESNFNLQATNTYLTSKVVHMSRQLLDSIPEEQQRSSPEDEGDGVSSSSSNNASVGTVSADCTPNEELQAAVSKVNGTLADVVSSPGPQLTQELDGSCSNSAINNAADSLEQKLISINIVMSQLEKEKEGLLGEIASSANTPTEVASCNEPDLVASCAAAVSNIGANATGSAADVVPKEAPEIQSTLPPTSQDQMDENVKILEEIRTERDHLLQEVEALRNHESDLIKSHGSLEGKLEELTNEKENICQEVQGLIEDVDKYVQQNTKLQHEKDELSKSVQELQSNSELVSVLQDSLRADKVLIAEKQEQISILEDQVRLLLTFLSIDYLSFQ